MEQEKDTILELLKTPDSIRLAQAFLPFFPADTQPVFAMLLKLWEFRLLYHNLFYNRRGFTQHPMTMVHILEVLKGQMDEESAEQLDMMLSMMSTMMEDTPMNDAATTSGEKEANNEYGF